MPAKENFSFEISLSVLNHLGRNLYRSFVTVIGEAISNSWDADAKNVWIYIDRTRDRFIIKNDGDGMTADDFQNKFLKIGYSKRKEGKAKSSLGRPFIGRKGIGKLALLSCAKKITVISKTRRKDYIGGVIDNTALDKAITDDLTPQQYKLGKPDNLHLRKYTKSHSKGTIISFEKIHGGIKNSLDVLKKIVALYFRFSLIDKSFNIFIDEKKITYGDIDDLANRTQFVWNINNLNDPYIHRHLKNLKEGQKKVTMSGRIKGFIASVSKPRDLSIMNVEERVGVDLFVNGRLREKNILQHIPVARLAESYLYGQIHLNELDDKTDMFTSDREGVVADDPKYEAFLTHFRKVILKVVDDWDKLRIKHRESGDAENERISRKERTSRDLFNVVSDEYTPPVGAKSKTRIDTWVDELADDAAFNFTSYAECFISENLIRNYIHDKKITLNTEAKRDSDHYRKKEEDNKDKGNISIEIRKKTHDLSYLDMDNLAYMVDVDKTGRKAALSRDADQYKPIRDAVAHTTLLTDAAKSKLTTVYENIKGRINKLLQ